MTRARRRGPLLVVASVAALAVLPGCGEGGGSATGGEPLADMDLPPVSTPRGNGTAPQAGTALRPPLAFHLRRRAQLRRSPGGKVITTLRTRTEFRSPQILAVARRRPGWVAVRTQKVGNHRVGWLPTDAGALFSQPRTIVVDLSKRTLTVFHRGRPAGRYRVAIGTSRTPTPVGRFAVTDRLRVKEKGPYGCCILALTGRQPRIAQGWGGGDRIAIHATPDERSVGRAISHGCLRTTERTMRRLMRQIRLGTPVRIKR